VRVFRVTLLTLLAVAIAYPATGAADSAPKFETNLYYNCLGDHGIGVPVGSDLVLRFSWGVKNRGLVESFLHGQQMTAVVDGVSLSNPMQHWSAPSYISASGYWQTTWRYDTGIVASFDHPYLIDIESFGTHAILDGVTFADDGSHRPYFWNEAGPLVTSFGPCFVGAF
jgi:hypothetical protein